MRELKLHNLAVITQNLPQGFDKHMRDINRSDNSCVVILSSFTSDREYKVIVERTKDGLDGHCACKGFMSLTKQSPDAAIDPCQHIAAALTTVPNWVPSSVWEPMTNQEVPTEKPMPRSQVETKPSIEAEPAALKDPVPDSAPQTRSHAVAETAILVRPVATILETLDSFHAFQDAKRALLAKTDFQKVFDGQYIKKSGWRKIAVFFGVSLSKISETELEGEVRTWAVTYRATAPGGQHQDATGYCSWDEQMGAGRVSSAVTTAANKVKSRTWTQDKADQYVAAQRAKLEHDIRATAETRAKNRAIADLVGGGEVSAEEMRLAK